MSAKRESLAAMNAMIGAILEGVGHAQATKDDGAIDGDIMLRSMEAIIAMALEAHPDMKTSEHISDQAAAVGERVRGYMLQYRAAADRLGFHAWDRLNGSLQAA
jgi:hypothetical protein